MKFAERNKILLPLLFAAAALLSSCYEHDQPFAKEPNIRADPQLVGVWRHEESLNYLQVELKDPKHYRIKHVTWEEDGERSQLDISSYLYEISFRPVMVSQLDRVTNNDHFSEMTGKWGYRVFTFHDEAASVEIAHLDVPKGAGLKEVTSALKEKDFVPFGKYDRTKLKSIPAKPEREHVLALRVKELEREKAARTAEPAVAPKVAIKPDGAAEIHAFFLKLLPTAESMKVDPSKGIGEMIELNVMKCPKDFREAWYEFRGAATRLKNYADRESGKTWEEQAWEAFSAGLNGEPDGGHARKLNKLEALMLEFQNTLLEVAAVASEYGIE